MSVLLAVAQRVVDLLAVQQGAQHAQVLAELARLHRVLAHDAHGGVAGADAEEGAAGRELVDGGDRMGGDRRQPDAARPTRRCRGGCARCWPPPAPASRRRRNRASANRPPRRVVAHRLEVDEQLPVRHARDDGDSELHGPSPSVCCCFGLSACLPEQRQRGDFLDGVIFRQARGQEAGNLPPTPAQGWRAGVRAFSLLTFAVMQASTSPTV